MPDFLNEGFMALYGEKQLGEIASGAFSAEQMQGFVSKVQLMKSGTDLPPRKAGGKLEVINKDGKDVRSVVDNTREVFTSLNCAGKVLEWMMFNSTYIRTSLSLSLSLSLSFALYIYIYMCFGVPSTVKESLL